MTNDKKLNWEDETVRLMYAIAHDMGKRAALERTLMEQDVPYKHDPALILGWCEGFRWGRNA